MGTGATGERFRDSRHPYADDLDVFGAGSLFQLISGARTPMGEARLAAWLSSAASMPEVGERQSRIAGLRTRIDLRERIAVVNAGARRRIEPAPLIAWAEAAPSLPPRLRPVIVMLALAFAGAVVVILRGGSGWPLAVLLPVDLVAPGVARQARQRHRRRPVVGHRIGRPRSAVESDLRDRA